MKRALVILMLLASVLAAPVLAVTPSEMLSDPALEARARDISKGLRCLVCRNENIDESNADLAADLRVLVRERLVAGDSDEAVVGYIVGRYGEYVLLKPTATGANLALWLAGPAMLILGGLIGWRFVRSRRNASAESERALSPEEEVQLKEILDR
ncbi:cytochrome c-type biogenesis protein [Tropicimonas sp. IMCC34043]|uniref:cytochrome c-type biogenesis protein n=1 Tax=Tropicimonas sp. IMCC34043 TaxID=2248760 RepID=UPI000E26F92A|nr:cytochrome c-type biogenesis protein [Tropicimonas sp. IMCC34043]